MTDFGLEVLHELGNREGNAVQIIFIHGLGGSRKGTWQDRESQGCWPDWLHSEKGMENVRIVLFGYNANFNFTAPNTCRTIAHFANQLLLELKHLRLRSGPVLVFYRNC
jgi:hypothetical protein